MRQSYFARELTSCGCSTTRRTYPQQRGPDRGVLVWRTGVGWCRLTPQGSRVNASVTHGEAARPSDRWLHHGGRAPGHGVEGAFEAGGTSCVRKRQWSAADRIIGRTAMHIHAGLRHRAGPSERTRAQGHSNRSLEAHAGVVPSVPDVLRERRLTIEQDGLHAGRTKRRHERVVLARCPSTLHARFGEGDARGDVAAVNVAEAPAPENRSPAGRARYRRRLLPVISLRSVHEASLTRSAFVSTRRLAMVER